MAFTDPSHRSSYNEQQIVQYFDRIALPDKYRMDHIATRKDATTPDKQLLFLSNLMKYHLAAIPFENLELHYSSTKIVSLEPQYLFQKIIQRNDGRGGRCMETNCLFGTVLRSLGFEVYSSGARVNESAQPVAATKGWKGPRHDGWNHMINIVTIAGKDFLVDVGFGGSGAPSHPVRLVSDQPSPNIGDQSVRVVLSSIPDHTRKDKQLWCYQFRHGDDRPWIDGYSFTETEFLPQDFRMMSFFTSNSKTSWLTYRVVCAKVLMEDEDLVGEIRLFENEVRRRVKGKIELLVTLMSEDDRVQALRKYFGLNLSEPEVLGIHGMSTEILWTPILSYRSPAIENVTRMQSRVTVEALDQCLNLRA